MKLAEFIDQLDGFDGIPPREKIQLFAWHLHVHKGRELFNNGDIRDCFYELHLPDPSVTKYIPRMLTSGDLLKIGNDFKLARVIRVALDARYGEAKSVVAVSRLLSDLSGKLPDLAEKTFLIETINCYRVGAYRACIVMSWNLAYSHLVHWVLDDQTRLANFNATIGRRFPKKAALQVAKYDDFLDELKEREVVDICATAGLTSGGITKILREKLDRRNTAAHPSGSTIVQSQADDMITDLVNNVVIALR